jgi:hypothetical protein
MAGISETEPNSQVMDPPGVIASNESFSKAHMFRVNLCQAAPKLPGFRSGEASCWR